LCSPYTQRPPSLVYALREDHPSSGAPAYTLQFAHLKAQPTASARPLGGNHGTSPTNLSVRADASTASPGCRRHQIQRTPWR
jgi:hypothetical protein